MVHENLARVSARALQEMAAADYEYARDFTDAAGDSVRLRESAKRWQNHAAVVAQDARAAMDRYLAQTLAN